MTPDVLTFEAGLIPVRLFGFMLKHIRRIFPFLIVPALLLAWQCGADKSALIRQEVETRTAAFVNRELAICRAQLLEDAGRMADSVLLSNAQAALRDSLSNRPNRPLPPAPLEPLDSLPVEPLYRQEQ